MIEPIHGTFIETRTRLTFEEDCWVYEQLDEWPPRLAQANHARFEVQKALYEFTPKQHEYAAKDRRDRSWYKRIGKILMSKYGDDKGFDPAAIELEVLMSDSEELIYG